MDRTCGRSFIDKCKSLKTLLIIIICVLFMGGVTSCSPQSFASTTLTKEQLEIEKLGLEVGQLKQEQSFYIIDKWFSIVGSILGSVAIMWAIFQGYRTFRQQAETQTQARIAELLTKLSDPQEEIRVGAARGLSRYVDDTIDEILSALRLEESEKVRQVLEDTLTKAKNKSISKIIYANSNTLDERIYLMGRLVEAGAKPEFTDSLLRFSNYASTFFSTINEFRFIYDDGKNYQNSEQIRFRADRESIAEDNVLLITKSKQLVILAKSTAKILAGNFRNNGVFQKVETHLDLTSANLYRANLRNVNFSKSILNRGLMRHVNLIKANLSKSDLERCDMYEAQIIEANFTEASLKYVHLRKANAVKTKFIRADLDDAVLSVGKFDYANFEGSHCIRMKFRGVQSDNVHFDQSDLSQAEFTGSKLIRASFKDAKCFRVDFSESDLSYSNMEGAKLCGANLQNAKLNNTNLKKVDFSGADVKNTDFRGSDLSKTNFRSVKNLETAIFDEGVVIKVGD